MIIDFILTNNEKRVGRFIIEEPDEQSSGYRRFVLYTDKRRVTLPTESLDETLDYLEGIRDGAEAALDMLGRRLGKGES